MSLSCPYKHVSYSTWRLNVLRTLFQSSEEPLHRVTCLRREHAKPAIHTRQYSLSRSAASSKNAIASQDDASVKPLRGGKTSKENAGQAKPFNPYSTEGRQALQNLITELKVVGGKVRDGHVDPNSGATHKKLDLEVLRDESALDASATGEPGPEDRQATESLMTDLLKSEKERGFISLRKERPSVLEPILGPRVDEAPTRRRSEKSDRGRSATSVTEDGLPIRESPVFGWVAEAVRRRTEEKTHPSYHHIQGLKNNPWAEILATPIRACQGSGARLPEGLLLNLGFVKNPIDEKIYLMPANLADLDALESKMARELAGRQDSVLSADSIEAQQMQSKEDVESLESDNPEEPSPQSETYPDYRKPIQTQSRLLSNQTFLNCITYAVTQPSKHGPKSSTPTTRESISGEVSKLVHFVAREAISTAQHYLQNKRRFDAALSGTSSSAPQVDEGKVEFSLNKLQWQVDTASRIVHIMRQRILIALRALVEAEGMSKAQDLPGRPSAVITLPIPKTREFKDDELQWQQSATGTGHLLTSNPSTSGLKIGAQAPNSLPMETSSPPDIDLSTSAEQSVSTPPQLTYCRLGHPEWLPGSIFLHIGLNEPSFPRSRTLPPLPLDNPLIPPMISVADTFRFPVFSIHRLFPHPSNTSTSPSAEGDLAELNKLLAQHAIFQTPASTGVPSAAPVDHFVFVRSLQGPARVLIEEVWRLWRYLGGENMDVDFSEEGEEKDGKPSLPRKDAVAGRHMGGAVHGGYGPSASPRSFIAKKPTAGRSTTRAAGSR